MAAGVDVLRDHGYEAWGNDLWQLRKFQWRERNARERLVVASVLSLPVPDAFCHAVISSGVIEHIGVTESALPSYSVRATEDQLELRASFLLELKRVTRPGGSIFIDCPNGSFPIDFWHGDAPGSPRFHGPSEAFLPTFFQIKRLASATMGAPRVKAISPLNRLQFRQASSHLYGRILRRPLAGLFHLMNTPGFRWLTKTPANPFLVVEIQTPT